MGADLSSTLAHLSALVACDTRNPPRAIAPGDEIFAFLCAALEKLGFRLELEDHGAGAVTLFAVRGAPRVLFNVHLDTVPSTGWDDRALRIALKDEHAIGLGVADTKGAAACLLTAFESTRGDAAVLFSTDEEANDPRCIAAFLGKEPTFDGVIVSEPTNCRAILAHRGIASARAVFRGTAGHASNPRALVDSALHEAIRWGTRALAFAEDEESREVGGLRGVRFNVGVLHAGTKANMIAAEAELRFGLRPRPGEVPEALVGKFAALAPDPKRASFETTFRGPSLAETAASRALATRFGAPIASAVDFWTEASLFAQAHFPAIVYGPGDVGVAHAPDEKVSFADLSLAAATYARFVEGGSR